MNTLYNLFGTGTSIKKKGVVKLVLWAQTYFKFKKLLFPHEIYINEQKQFVHNLKGMMINIC